MTGLRAGALAGVVLGAWACAGGPSNENSLPMPNNGGAPGHMASGTVTISIETPAADPALHVAPGGLIAIRAHLSVDGGSDYIDANSIHVTLTAQGSSQAIETGQLVLESGDSYTGRVSVGDLKTGTYTLTLTARSSGGALGEATVDFLIDGSPVLFVNSPTEGGSYKRTLTIDVIASDPVGLMGPPTATVGDIPVPLSEAGAPDNYRGTIDFDAQMPPLFGHQLLTVTVINNDGQKVEVQRIFTIDNDGPSITSTVPVPGQMAGGIILLAANISDPAGIIDSSVIAVIGDDTSTPLFEIPLKPRGAGVYGALFDATRLTQCPEPPAIGPCIIYPTISFRASDQVGNETTVGYAFTVDNIAPVADLDSANVRFLRKDGYCSREFDPLSLNRYSGDMPNDRAVVPQVFDLRARVQDDGNAPAGIKGVPIAGIDPNATSVYILDDETQPLVVDVDGDGTCDAINPKLIPTTEPPKTNNQVLKVRLAGVPKQGAPDYRMDSNPPPANVCGYDPLALPPEFLCDNGQPYATIGYAHGQPAVWSVEPVNGAWCMGGQFDARANNITEGWACIAVQSADLAGNSSVSPPLRVYIRYDGAGAGVIAPANLGAAPPCTGIYNKATGAVTNGTCTARRFDHLEYCFAGDC